MLSMTSMTASYATDNVKVKNKVFYSELDFMSVVIVGKY
jgi:hypothetical protein